MGRGIPLPSQLGDLGSIVSSHSGVRDEIEFCKTRMPKQPSGATYFTQFCHELRGMALPPYSVGKKDIAFD